MMLKTMPVNSLSQFTNFHFYPSLKLNHKPKKLNVGPTCKLNVQFEDILAVTHNKVLIAAGVSAAIGQLSKPFSGVFLYGRDFDVKAIFQAGGFPSTHSSAVVATATCLALERGFSDSLFGMAAVYAGLIMYDAQGVRREVGIHAKTLNKLLLERQTKPVTDLTKDFVNSVPGKPSSRNLETSTFPKEQTVSTQLLESKTRKGMDEADSASPHLPLLKESIGHTEVEVIAGALLGFLVSLTVNLVM